MTPYYADDRATVLQGDCLDVLRTLPDNSVDAIVTDPPYGLEFMGKEWDGPKLWREYVTEADRAYVSDGRAAPKFQTARPSYAAGVPFQLWCQQWATEALRVLKPGGHMLAFGGTRTYHRLTCGIEDAGFEIRDCLAWLYGSGFPKSRDVSKAIDAEAGAVRDVIGRAPGARSQDPHSFGNGHLAEYDITAPATDAARRWQGWGTALKPAHEPIVMARKPLQGTVAGNVQAWGTGGLNIDGTRIAYANPADLESVRQGVEGGYRQSQQGTTFMASDGAGRSVNSGGRWPANVTLDEAAAQALDQMSGELATTAPSERTGLGGRSGGIMGDAVERIGPKIGHDDFGGASRFMYTAKAGSDERITMPKPGGGYGTQNYGGYKTRTCNVCSVRFPATGGPPCGHDDWDWQEQLDRKPDRISHPTVKPLALMRWLTRLVTPPGGLVLDMFAGSGATVEAALLEGFRCIAIEREPDYLPMITQRIHRRRDPIAYLTQGGHDLGLFGDYDEPPRSDNPHAEPVEHAAGCHYEDEPCSDWCAWEGGRFPEQWQAPEPA